MRESEGMQLLSWIWNMNIGVAVDGTESGQAGNEGAYRSYPIYPICGNAEYIPQPSGSNGAVVVGVRCGIQRRGAPTGGDAPIAGISRVGQRSVEQTCASHSRNELRPSFCMLARVRYVYTAVAWCPCVRCNGRLWDSG